MRDLIKRRPSPAMIVASIALLVALGGTSFAAVSQLPRFSVGTPQLKSNAVTSPKVANRSLRAIDFARGQLPRGPRGLRGPQGLPGQPGAAGPTGATGPAGVAAPGYVAQVASDTSTGVSSTSSTSFVDLAGAEETIAVPTGETARLYVWFTAESICTATGWCSVRIIVDGTEIEPASGTDYAFDSGPSTTDEWEGHALARVSATLGAGSHVVKVQGAVVGAGSLTLDDWALVVQRVRLS
ncbi:MAG TPA: collagen-like protein [Gaiellaceae bacterium]|nr:collagen-like protein [Gaiellaceae bacterium]